MVRLEELPDELLIKIIEYNGHDNIFSVADTSTRSAVEWPGSLVRLIFIVLYVQEDATHYI